MYKIKENRLEKVEETGFKQEGKLEQDLEAWVENDPSILGEDLLIIGRQVAIPEVKDKIDLLALDTNGRTVIVELKREKIKEPVDIQALRYASYISRWEYKDFDKQADSYFKEKGKGEEDFKLNEKFEQFLDSRGIDEAPPDINQEQRIIIVGSQVKEKLGSVALWLREHSIDIKVIEVSFFKDNGAFYLYPQTIIPPPTSEKFEIGKLGLAGDRPWLTNGEEWHLKGRCGAAMREKLMQFNDMIAEHLEGVDGPVWNQKFYVSYKVSNHFWLWIDTHKTALALNFTVKKGDFNAENISKELGLQIFEKQSTLSEKLQLESSVEVVSREKYDFLRIRIKEEFNVNSEQFLKFVKTALASFKKVVA